MAILTQFLLRLAFGLAAAMAVTSPRQVTSGYYRNHLYVLLGLNVLAALTLWRSPQTALGCAATAAVLSYVGAVIWLYEKPKAGLALLVAVALIDLAAARLCAGSISIPPGPHGVEHPTITLFLLNLLDPLTGGLALGVTIAAMFLGHWYLNSPTMELAPLQRLVRLMMAAVAARAVVCAVGLALLGMPAEPFAVYFLPLRWLFGIFSPLLLGWMTLRTLEVPNTQSATGILYVAVIAVFTGELCSQLLSHGALYPL